MNFGSLIDTSKLGGWVRAAVASGLGVLIAKFPGLGNWLTPDTQAALGAFAAALVIGVWSQIAKSLDADYAKPEDKEPKK